MWQIQEKAESPNEPFILLSVFGQPSGSGSGPFDDIIEDVISRFPQRSKVTKFKPHSHTSSNQKRNFFAESIDKIDDAVEAVGSDAGNGTQNGKPIFVIVIFSKNQKWSFIEMENTESLLALIIDFTQHEPYCMTDFVKQVELEI